MWTIVLFCKENSISVVPKNWLCKNDTICSWPPVLNVSSYVKRCVEPEPTWNIFSIRPLGNGKVYDNYLKARAASRLAEETSDLTSESDSRKRKRKVNKIYSSSSSDDDSNNNEPHVFPELPAGSFACRFSNTNLNESNEELIESSSTSRSQQLTPDIRRVPYSSVRQVLEQSSDATLNSKEINEGLVGTPSSSRSQPTALRAERRHISHSNDLQTSSAFSDDFLRKLQHQVSLMNFKMNNIQSDVTSIMDLLRKTDETTVSADFNYESLPLQTIESVSEFEEFLKMQDNFTKYTKFIQKIGGSSVYECVKRALTRLMSNELAMNYSWNGRKAKQAFAGLMLQQGLTIGIQANLPTKNCSEKDVESSVKSWLRHAKARTINKNN